ncbi:hypothetical protein AB1Y20_022313 [Prymnesium parvum]|uniref:Uncharacterized protein n=1 Tax=Prymnesium parvum TaxID=97485 RepID=A0AB34JIZ4_PRYPA
MREGRWADDESSSGEEDEQPLLSRKKKPPPSASLERLLTLAYFCVMAINGGMIGAFGPSLQMLERATGLTEYEVGKFVMQNRVSKLVGTLAWCAYAQFLQEEQHCGRPRGQPTHKLITVLLCATAVFSFVIGHLGSSARALQVSLICWGFVYGVTDSGVTSLTLWRWAHDDRRRRFDVALLNSGFTVGALITPVLVAASLRYGGGRWTFDVVAAAAVGLAALFPSLPDAPMPPPAAAAEDDSCAALAVVGSSGGLERGKSSELGLDEYEGRTFRAHGAEAHVTSRQMSKLARQEATKLVRVARQQLRALHSPSDELLHQALLVTAMCTVLMVTTGSEHALATWLAPFGVREGALGEQRMAVMSSTFWGVMCAGRIAWTFLSAIVSSSWPMLFFDIGIALFSSLLLFGYGSFSAPEGVLWAGAIGVGIGVSSALPCAYTLPSEAQVPMTPWVITLLNTANTFGETTFPYLVGFAFDRHLHWALGALLAVSQVISLNLAVYAWMRTQRRRYRMRL